jgi:hypothetical protein
MSDKLCLMCGKVPQRAIEVDYDCGGLSGYLCDSHTLGEVASLRQTERDIDGDECCRFSLYIAEGYFKVDAAATVA